jgi:hypothetical protein
MSSSWRRSFSALFLTIAKLWYILYMLNGLGYCSQCSNLLWAGWSRIKSRGGGLGQDLLHPSRVALGPTQSPIEWVPGLFPRGKWPGRGVDLPPQYRAKVKERAVPLFLLWVFMACSIVNLLFVLFEEMQGHCLLCIWVQFSVELFVVHGAVQMVELNWKFVALWYNWNLLTLWKSWYKLKHITINIFTAIINLSRFNNSCLRTPLSTLVDLIFQSHSFSLNQLTCHYRQETCTAASLYLADVACIAI